CRASARAWPPATGAAESARGRRRDCDRRACAGIRLSGTRTACEPSTTTPHLSPLWATRLHCTGRQHAVKGFLHRFGPDDGPGEGWGLGFLGLQDDVALLPVRALVHSADQERAGSVLDVGEAREEAGAGPPVEEAIRSLDLIDRRLREAVVVGNLGVQDVARVIDLEESVLAGKDRHLIPQEFVPGERRRIWNGGLG